MRNPTGGKKDTTPPVMVKSTPENKIVNFNKAIPILLQFDEFIKLNKLNEELIISPPLIPKPTITTKGKKLSINLNECELEPNTTYSINLGDALVDHNESNPYKNLIYVLSTGATIDSLSLSGTIWDMEKGEKPYGASVLLYTDLTDTFYNTDPSYLVKTDSNGYYSINNLPESKFTLLVLQDENKNKQIDYKEKVGFSESLINLSANSALERINIFPYKHKPNVKIKDTIYSNHNIKFLFNKELADVNIVLKSNNSPYLNYRIKKDTLLIYPTTNKSPVIVYMDDLVLTNTPWDSIKNITFNNSYKVLNKYNLHKKDTLLLEFNSPYSSINKNNITLINNNKTPLDFELININPFKLGIYNNYKVGQEYYFIVNKTIINPDSNNTIPDTIGIKVLSNKSLGNLMCLISNYSDAITNKLLLLYKDDKLLKSKKIIGFLSYIGIVGYIF
jgi:hypothetical protein